MTGGGHRSVGGKTQDFGSVLFGQEKHVSKFVITGPAGKNSGEVGGFSGEKRVKKRLRGF